MTTFPTALGSLPLLLMVLVTGAPEDRDAAPSATAAPSTAGEAATYAVDQVHSSLLFRVKHMKSAWFYGRFARFAGDFTEGEAGLERVALKVEAASIDSFNEKRDNHLKSQDFFSVRQFPDLVFRSSKVTKEGEAFRVEGELEMLGKTRPVSFLAERTGSMEHPRAGKIAGYHAELTIERSKWGMTYGIENGVLGDAVTLIISLEGRRAE